MAAILMIDDERAILELVKNGLRKDGHFVTTYTSAAQVPLDKLNRYDLIMLDIMMPDVDGFSYCDKIRSLVDCPILFLTAKKNKSTERTIKRINIQYEGTRAYIRIEADDFLHNMARFMIGMLLDVGNGIKKPEDVKRCLDGENVQMSLPAESYGLFLVKVVY